MESLILSYLNKDFIFQFLTISLKIFFLYFFYFASLESMLGYFWKDRKIDYRVVFPVFFLFTLLPWVHSVVLYPQVYADFFYGRHSYLLPFLYFLTDHIHPQYPLYLLIVLLFGYLLFILYKLFRTAEFQYITILIYLSLFAIWHYRGDFLGLAITYFVFKFFQIYSARLNRLVYFPIFLFLFTLGYIFYFIENMFQYPNLNPESRKYIFIISADSLRKDRIGKIRDGESITPNIDNFLLDSVSYTDHNTTIPRTFPSWADLLTGNYSMSHKVRAMFPAPEEAENIGSSDFPTLPQYLSRKNFLTGVFSNFAGDIFPRAGFGFETVETPDFNAKILLIQKSLEPQIFLLPLLTGSMGGGEFFPEIRSFSNLGDGRLILDKMIPFIRLNTGRDLFVTSFFSVTHFPYSPQFPYYKKYTSPDYYGQFKYFKFVDPTNDKKPDENDIEQIRSIFDASINAFDSDFGEFIQFLHDYDLYKNSLILLTGDHGETLYEDIHGHGHGEHLRGENVIGVPLIVKYPDFVQNTIRDECQKLNNETCSTFSGITSSIDILPTLLDIYGIEPDTTLPGRSLKSGFGKKSWEDDRLIYAETGIWFSDVGDHFFQKQRILYPNILELHRVVPENNYQIMITEPYYRETIAFAKHRAILSKNFKLIYIPTHDGVLYEFYNREEDPLNTKNLYPNYYSYRFKNELLDLVKKWEGATIVDEYILPPQVGR